MRAIDVLAEAEHATELAVSPIFIGIGVFAFLIFLLLVTLGIGKGRPHA